ncbi:porin [Flavisphingomonas formosensis]|uniref:porin n=1 Tax=Flavisphingomonas formosensis TaxID=861534 RepID=UPI0012FB4FD3|nr:porin [Sphingomonas formosensis]
MVGAAFAAIAILCVPVSATAAKAKKRASSVQLLTDTGSFGSFTPAAADPRMAAALGRASISSVGLRFTPSAAPGGRRAVTVAIRARATTPAEAARSASLAANTTPTSVTPSAYNLGVSVGWQRFAISGDIARVDTGVLPGSREAMDVGFAYVSRKWSTRLSVGTDRSIGNQLGLVNSDSAYTVDLGGTYALTHNIELNGGLRYRSQHERLDFATDERRDSQAVYLGTAFRF